MSVFCVCVCVCVCVYVCVCVCVCVCRIMNITRSLLQKHPLGASAAICIRWSMEMTLMRKLFGVSVLYIRDFSMLYQKWGYKRNVITQRQ